MLTRLLKQCDELVLSRAGTAVQHLATFDPTQRHRPARTLPPAPVQGTSSFRAPSRSPLAFEAGQPNTAAVSATARAGGGAAAAFAVVSPLVQLLCHLAEAPKLLAAAALYILSDQSPFVGLVAEHAAPLLRCAAAAQPEASPLALLAAATLQRLSPAEMPSQADGERASLMPTCSVRNSL